MHFTENLKLKLFKIIFKLLKLLSDNKKTYKNLYIPIYTYLYISKTNKLR